MTSARLSGGMIAAACLIAASPALAQTPPASAPQTPPAKPADAKPAEPTVSGVTVSGARKEIETAIDRRSYSVAGDLQGKTGNISDVLRNVPSVQVDVNGNVSLRGDPNVTVLMDGRPSAMLSKETLAQVLQSMPADQIERIEVITNPSAEFRADGSAGIINLVTKKAKGAGKTGSVRVNGASTGSGQVSLTHGFNADKLSSIESLSVVHQEANLMGRYDDTQKDPAGGTIDRRDILTGGVNADAVQGRISMDYDLSKKVRLTAGLTGAWQAGTQELDDAFTQINGAGATTAAFTRTSPQDIVGKNAQADFNVRRTFGDQHDLNLHAAYSQNEGRSNRVDVTTPVTPAGAAFAQRVIRMNDNDRTSLSGDFQKPLAGGQFKAGYLFEYIDNEIHHSGALGPSAAALVSDPSQTDVFGDVETHNQGYITLQKKIGAWTALPGLRIETVHLDLDQETLNIQSEQDYQRLYPTLHLSRDLGVGKKMTVSYSKRVQRPIPQDLDPFRYTANANVVIEGNPNLVPQDTDSYELGFERRKDTASQLLTFYHRQTNNAFSVVLTDQGGGVLLQRRENVGHQSNTGGEVVFSDRLTPKISYNLSANLYRTEISAPNLGFTQTNSSTTAFGRANLNWQATPKDFVQINVFANGKQILPQGYSAPTMSGNIGYRRNLNDKVSLMLVLQDPFKSLKNKLVITTPTGQTTRLQQQESRVLSATLVWNFAGKPRDTGFDFAPGGTGGGGAVVP